jgi:hypothetical protein
MTMALLSQFGYKTFVGHLDRKFQLAIEKLSSKIKRKKAI